MKIRKHYKSFKKVGLYEVSSITSRLNRFGSMLKSRLIWTRHICWDLWQFELYPLHQFYRSFLKALFVSRFRGTANGSVQISKTWSEPPAAQLESLTRSGRAWQTLGTDLWRGDPAWILILILLGLGKREYWELGMLCKDPSLCLISSCLVASTGSLAIHRLLILIRGKENLGMVLCASWADVSDDSRIIIPLLCGCSACWDHPAEVLHYSCLHRDKTPGAPEGSEVGWGVGMSLREIQPSAALSFSPAPSGMLDPARGVCKALRRFFISRIISGFLDNSQEKAAELRPSVTREIFFSFIWISVICRILMFHLGNQNITSFDVASELSPGSFECECTEVTLWQGCIYLPQAEISSIWFSEQLSGLQQRRGKPYFLMTTELYLLSFMLLFTRFRRSWTEGLLIL